MKFVFKCICTFIWAKNMVKNLYQIINSSRDIWAWLLVISSLMFDVELSKIVGLTDFPWNPLWNFINKKHNTITDYSEQVV